MTQVLFLHLQKDAVVKWFLSFKNLIIKLFLILKKIKVFPVEKEDG